jgi:hypothetical protein
MKQWQPQGQTPSAPRLKHWLRLTLDAPVLRAARTLRRRRGSNWQNQRPVGLVADLHTPDRQWPPRHWVSAFPFCAASQDPRTGARSCGGVRRLVRPIAKRPRNRGMTRHRHSHVRQTTFARRRRDTVGQSCGLTFELSGPRREGAWPARWMMTLAGSRAKRLAGGGPLERRVRPHRLRHGE